MDASIKEASIPDSLAIYAKCNHTVENNLRRGSP